MHPHSQGPYLPWFSHPTPGSFSALAHRPACPNPLQGQGACLDSQGPAVSYTSPLGSAPGPASLSQHTPVPLPSVCGPWNGSPAVPTSPPALGPLPLNPVLPFSGHPHPQPAPSLEPVELPFLCLLGNQNQVGCPPLLHMSICVSGCAHVSVCTCVCACVCQCVYVSVRACVCTRVSVCTCLCACVCQCVYVCVSACMCVHTCLCVHACQCVHVSVCACAHLPIGKCCMPALCAHVHTGPRMHVRTCTVPRVQGIFWEERLALSYLLLSLVTGARRQLVTKAHSCHCGHFGFWKFLDGYVAFSPYTVSFSCIFSFIFCWRSSSDFFQAPVPRHWGVCTLPDYNSRQS